jgi:pyrimidine deaminase RibD-like protein
LLNFSHFLDTYEDIMMNQYDECLKQVIDHLAKCWMNPNVGIVGAGIFEPSHPPVLATSKKVGEGKWLHAEVNALKEYQSQYGLPKSNTIIVVTLSPCIRRISKSRIGCSCTNLLQQSLIRRVHVGAIDQNQGINDVLEYEKYGLDVTLSQDAQCQIICENLKNIFRIYGDRINCDLLAIKKEVNDCIFQSYISV